MKKRDERKTKKRLCSMVPSCLSCSKPFDDSENIQSLFDLKLIGQVFLNSYVKEKKIQSGQNQVVFDESASLLFISAVGQTGWYKL
jgi:hypothetical protein